ncbi:hypothetical protein GGI12_004877 [Dipsacomyces acuminosporus]|nr:hypothetical protein GGI12_004877 [Dipsacomyces acuminosporus]
MVRCQWGKKRKRGPKPKGTAKSQQIRGVSTAKDRRALSPLGSGAGTNTSPTLKQAALPPIAEAANAESSMPNGDDESIYLEKEPLASGPHPEILQPPPLDKEMAEFYSDRVDPEIRETVIYYFDYFYPLCPAFHPSLFIRRVVNGDVDPLLLDAMRATVARVITKKTGRFVDGHAIARSVKERILLGLERPTVDFLRVLIIMTLLAGSHGEYISYNSIICLAASLVVRMGLHKLDLYKRPNAGSWEEWVELQIKRRIFWLVYQTDSYQSMLTGRAMSIAESSVFVSAPCSDFEWDVVFHPNLAKASAAAKSLQKSSQSPQSPSRATPSSSSQSSSNLLQSLNVNPDHIIATGSFSYSFMALCELTAIIARINTFLCDAKASSTVLESTVVAASSGGNGAGGFGSDKAASSGKNKFRDGPFPAVDFLENEGDTTGSLVHKIRRSVKLTSEYPTFIELDNRLADWKNGLLLPEELCDESMPAEDISYFGTADHRRFMMRVRYFCLHCYYVPIVLVLHQSNRPSFFTEYEQPLEVRLNRRFTGVVDALTPSPLITDTHTNDDSGNGNSSSSNNSNDADYALRQMLSMAFADTWNEGLLAYDIESKSWQICVEAAHGLSEHLERNSDFPLERFDQVIPFCIFMATSVLLRQTKICKRLLGTQIDGIMTEEERVQRLRGAGGYAAVNAELARCIRHIKHQWSTLNSLGSLWDVEGMEQLLKSMQIDEVANAADLFSNLSL